MAHDFTLTALANTRTPNALGRPAPLTPHEKARAQAQEFEAVFLNSMFQEMFTGIDGDGPFGGGAGAGTWRSFLTDEYAKSFAQAGGVGISTEVYRTLIAQQEGSSR